MVLTVLTRPWGFDMCELLAGCCGQAQAAAVGAGVALPLDLQWGGRRRRHG